MSEQIAIAKAIATVAHLGQVDKAGNPYIDHPRRVAETVSPRFNRDYAAAVSAAWLHDVLEDTMVTSDDLKVAGVSHEVIKAVEMLTRTDEQAPDEYYEAIRYEPIALAVKLADIADNTNPGRLALLDDATIARLTRKYAKARLLLGVEE